MAQSSDGNAITHHHLKYGMTWSGWTLCLAGSQQRMSWNDPDKPYPMVSFPGNPFRFIPDTLGHSPLSTSKLFVFVFVNSFPNQKMIRLINSRN